MNSHTTTPMLALQHCWYNGLTAGLGLSPAMFQLSQPALPIPPSDRGLWDCADTLPPRCLTLRHGAHPARRFFDEYEKLVHRIQPQPGPVAPSLSPGLQAAWLEHLAAQHPAPKASQLPALYQRWAMRNAPSARGEGAAVLARAVLSHAPQRALLPYQGPDARPADFAGTYAALLQTLGYPTDTHFTFDSAAASDDVQETWAGGAEADVEGLWLGGRDAPASLRFASSRVTVDVRFQALAVWTATPGDWYHSSLLNLAYSSRTAPPWTAAEDWDSFFGPEGSMRYLVASLVIVSGLRTSLTSSASYDKSEQEAVRRQAQQGLWPFYIPGSSAATSSVEFDGSSHLRIETGTQAGLPLVLGANVLGISRYLGHGGD